jgi:hypothetical protein
LKNGYANLIEPNKAIFEKHLESLKELAKRQKIDNLDKIIALYEEKLKVFDNIKNNWEIIEKDAAKQLLKEMNVAATSIDEEYRQIQEEQDKIYGRESIEYAESVPSEIKRYLHGIPMIDANGKKVTGFLGLPIYVPYDVVYNNMRAALSSAAISKLTVNEVKSILESYSDKIPFLANVKELIEVWEANNELDTINKFMTHINSHTLSMKFVQFATNPKTGAFEIRVYNTNSSNTINIIFN